MLGRFLELSVAAHPIGESFEFYRSLGFAGVATGDVLVHPYAVVDDGRLCIGLHDRDLAEPCLTFIRPDLKNYSRALRRQNIRFEFARLADDEFNELGFRDPANQLIVLIEAQTFSPGARRDLGASVCGAFLEFSVMTTSLMKARGFWNALGFATSAEGETPHPWARLTGYGTSIGLHQAAHFASGPSFVTTNLGVRLEYLQAKGIEAQRASSGVGSPEAAAILPTPHGTPIYLFDESAGA